MTIDELDLIEKVYELKIKNKKELAEEILKKSNEGYDILFLCTIVNSWIAQNYKPGEIKVPLTIIRNVK
ncbi:hypothetical protein [Methanothermobacter tenebrarum]|uniref:Uncharacterized protein n=1 Tax=Methanothermobacter tenebrarum TaxID=680118 RepID=A0A328PHP0_9EURY|nr:hypothetical protein [Methanothermobacter tenebrarum]MBC7100656.1 hypothetical protein [Methanobacteriales archaeon]MBC7118747.1 hypothetical protein [Methanobacteriaceae archaeon]NPV65339.1 hypothetical protein [Methanobacteriaceae archaeon]RAO78954.1 hypothetical protein DPC56_05870 [Methanothermobacter tenebrarum]